MELKGWLYFFLIGLGLFSKELSAQELKAKVSINTERLGTVDAQQFVEMERQLTEMLNNTRWTSAQFSPAERIECAFAINLTAVEEERKYTGELYVTAQRPVYNSSYQSPLLVWRDRDLNFEFQPFDRLEYSPNEVRSNLVASVIFYAYYILALDFDSFSPLGGNVARNELRQLVRLAGQANPEWKGWAAFDNDYNRYAIAEALSDAAQEPFRQMWYTYHRRGLDELVANVQRGRTTLLDALSLLESVWQNTPRSPLLILFSQTKLSELVKVAEKASQEEKQRAHKILSKIYPTEGNTLDALKR